MDSRHLVDAALRVLRCWTIGETPAPDDARILRAQALPQEAHLALDDLACAVVARECRKMGPEPEHPRRKDKTA